MAIQATQFTLSTVATLVATGANATVSDRATAIVSAPSATIYAGGPNVTSTSGIPISPTGWLSIELGPGDLLYLIAASGTPTVQVVTTRTGAI